MKKSNTILGLIILASSLSASASVCVDKFPVGKFKVHIVTSADYKDYLGKLKISKKVLEGKDTGRLTFSLTALPLAITMGGVSDQVSFVSVGKVDGQCIYSLTNKNKKFEYGPALVQTAVKGLGESKVIVLSDASNSLPVLQLTKK